MTSQLRTQRLHVNPGYLKAAVRGGFLFLIMRCPWQHGPYLGHVLTGRPAPSTSICASSGRCSSDEITVPCNPDCTEPQGGRLVKKIKITFLQAQMDMAPRERWQVLIGSGDEKDTASRRCGLSPWRARVDVRVLTLASTSSTASMAPWCSAHKDGSCTTGGIGVRQAAKGGPATETRLESRCEVREGSTRRFSLEARSKEPSPVLAGATCFR